MKFFVVYDYISRRIYFRFRVCTIIIIKATRYTSLFYKSVHPMTTPKVDVRRLVCQALLPPERTSLHIIKALQDPRRLADRDRLPASHAQPSPSVVAREAADQC